MTISKSTKQHACWCGFLAAVFALPVVSNTVFAHPVDNTHAQPTPATAPTLTSAMPVAVTLPQPAVKPRRPKLITQVASRLSGIASWYGRALHGHRTASGETFDEAELTACHRTLPFGTMVRVTNLRNHLSVIVRITDRGVLNPERVIDLSSAAADKLDMLRMGTAPVSLAIVTP